MYWQAALGDYGKIVMLDVVNFLDYSDGFYLHKDVPSVLVRDSDTFLTPLVSIMIPTYRRPALLREAIESALAQTTPIPFEVVVVDNDSDQELADEVDKAIASFGVHNLRLFRNQENIGMFGNWNRCIELARGKWLTILNDDDLLAPSFLDECLKVLDKSKLIKLVLCKTKTLDNRRRKSSNTGLARIRKLGRYLREKSYKQSPYRLRLSDYFLTNPHNGSLGALIERNAALTIGGISQKYYPSADYIFFVRFAMSNIAFYLPKVLATYRIGVNETLNADLCMNVIHQGYQIRNELIPYINANPLLLRNYSRLWSINKAFSYRDLWNSDFNISKALPAKEDINTHDWVVFIKFNIIKVLLNALFKRGIC